MHIVMIAVHKYNNRITGFRLLDTDSNTIQDVPKNNLIGVLSDGKATVENIALENGSLIGTNGTLERYPTIINGELQGKSSLIILKELVDNKYRLTNYTGNIVDMLEQEVIRYAESEGIANGKIVSNKDRRFISSINGTYEKDKLFKDREYGEKLKVKMGLLSCRDYKLNSEYKATAADDTISELVLSKGVLGIQKGGFKHLKKLKTVRFPSTLMSLGESSFEGCTNIEEITIPEGIEVIPSRCFYKCEALKRVYLPNSLRRIDNKAFTGCRSLLEISCGKAPIDIDFGAIPGGVRRKRRIK